MPFLRNTNIIWTPLERGCNVAAEYLLLLKIDGNTYKSQEQKGIRAI